MRRAAGHSSWTHNTITRRGRSQLVLLSILSKYILDSKRTLTELRSSAIFCIWNEAGFLNDRIFGKKAFDGVADVRVFDDLLGLLGGAISL